MYNIYIIVIFLQYKMTYNKYTLGTKNPILLFSW